MAVGCASGVRVAVVLAGAAARGDAVGGRSGVAALAPPRMTAAATAAEQPHYRRHRRHPLPPPLPRGLSCRHHPCVHPLRSPAPRCMTPSLSCSWRPVRPLLPPLRPRRRLRRLCRPGPRALPRPCPLLHRPHRARWVRVWRRLACGRPAPAPGGPCTTARRRPHNRCSANPRPRGPSDARRGRVAVAARALFARVALTAHVRPLFVV